MMPIGNLPAFSAPDRVKTANGAIEGTGRQASGVREFKGVPCAAPPVGNLRFAPPQPVSNWTGVRQAAQFGPRCMQLAVFGDMGFRSNGMSEDCLYLNIWTPAKSAKSTSAMHRRVAPTGGSDDRPSPACGDDGNLHAEKRTGVLKGNSCLSCGKHRTPGLYSRQDWLHGNHASVEPPCRGSATLTLARSREVSGRIPPVRSAVRHQSDGGRNARNSFLFVRNAMVHRRQSQFSAPELSAVNIPARYRQARYRTICTRAVLL
jgi:hypothetical protein